MIAYTDSDHSNLNCLTLSYKAQTVTLTFKDNMQAY